MNLRWSWDPPSEDLFRWVDPEAWESTGHDPIRVLAGLTQERIETLITDPGFMEFLERVAYDLDRYMEAAAWYQKRGGKLRSVAYFSPEYGISEAVPQYSGGLGVLAGDHLKAASSLGLPMVGVGLFYKEGYFRQQLNADGWQEEHYPTLDPANMALSSCGTQIKIDMAGTSVVAQLWLSQVGRIPLYLLDTDLSQNPDEFRVVTDRLYGGGEEHRLQQELLLGAGGVRALDAMGVKPQVFHMNEGHAGFLALERIRQLIVDHGLEFSEAIEAVRATTAFTTHTPVPAGIDQFSRPLMEKYFSSWAQETGVPFDRLMALGQHNGSGDGPFNMAMMCLRLSGRANGVSELHSAVTRQMFQHLWPNSPMEEVPIRSITNGVHPRTWIAPGMSELFDRYVLPEWNEAGPQRWAHIHDARDDELWRLRLQNREALVTFVRDRMRKISLATGASSLDLDWIDDVLDPRILTIGFARRFAEYKRATLLLTQPDRLRSLLMSDTPIQIVFAGKAHPADNDGKQMIRQLVQFCRDPAVRHRIVFIEGYDISVARALYQGCDIWLNTPRRPLEACGTSGEKAALNGALNVSTLDGWWDEMFDGENGWAISSAEDYEDLGRRDEVEAASLFDLLERHIIPRFYQRSESGIPTAWIQRIKASLASLGPKVSASRMVRDYVIQMYEPLGELTDALSADGYSRARKLAAWKARVRETWDGVKIRSFDSEDGSAALGSSRVVEASVELGALSPEDVEVQIVHGAVGPNGELERTSIAVMGLQGMDGDSSMRYSGEFPCDLSGKYGFAVRVVPRHDDMTTYAELACITWA